MGGKKKLYVFAGPNGSGKSTIIEELQKETRIGFYINADILEKILRENKYVNLSSFGIYSLEKTWKSFLEKSTLSQKINETGLQTSLKFERNIILTTSEANPYDAALLAEFLRQQLLVTGLSFSFETVMSHPSKLEFLQQAKHAGYKCILHFISTESPIINKQRVLARVKKGGHPVDPDKIEERWYKSLELLHQIIPYTTECYLYDNSKKKTRLFMYIKSGKTFEKLDSASLPQWYKTYVKKDKVKKKKK